MSNSYGGLSPKLVQAVPWAAKIIFSPAAIVIFALVIIGANVAAFGNNSPSGSLLLRFPFAGRLIVKACLVRISRSLGFMLGQGMTLPSAVGETAKIMDIGAFEIALLKAAEETETGSTLSEALQESGLFPGTFTALVRAGEKKEDLPQYLLETASIYERELNFETKGAIKLVEPALIGVLGVITGLILCAVFYPIYIIPGMIN
jgi:type II secretory pathway component PulF